MTDETRSTYIMVGFAALGVALFWANRPSKTEDLGSTPEEDADRIRKTLSGEISGRDVMSDDLMRLKRKLDRHATGYDRIDLERGLGHELEQFSTPSHSNRLMAQKIAMENLRQDPNYYKALDGILPDTA